VIKLRDSRSGRNILLVMGKAVGCDLASPFYIPCIPVKLPPKNNAKTQLHFSNILIDLVLPYNQPIKLKWGQKITMHRIHRTLLAALIFSLAACTASPTPSAAHRTGPVSSSSPWETKTETPQLDKATVVPTQAGAAVAETPSPTSTAQPMPTASKTPTPILPSSTLGEDWKIAFALVKTSSEESTLINGIYIYSDKTEQLDRITSKDKYFDYIDGLSWSPDGKQIVFFWDGTGFPKGPELYIVNTDGSGEKFLTYGVSPSWSPDGKEIVFCRDGDIYKINVYSRTISPIKISEEIEAYPVWSPDGNWIAFSSFTDKPKMKYSLNLMKPDGSMTRTIPIDPDLGNSRISWSPDGKRLSFRSINACGDIYIVNIANLKTQKVLDTPEGKSDAEFSKDGKWLVYREVEDNVLCGQLLEPLVLGWQIFLVDINGKNRQPLKIRLGPDFQENFPVFSPVVPLELNKKYIVTVLGDKLLLRDKPSLTASYNKVFAPGAELLTLEGPQMGGKDTWWRVKEVSTGLEGWVREGAGWLRPAGQEE
jgi:Tol biopolymer transport system component